MNASIVSLLLATTPLPDASADALAVDGFAVPTSLASALPASLPALTSRATGRAADAKGALQGRTDCAVAARVQAPDAAILFMRDTRYALG